MIPLTVWMLLVLSTSWYAIVQSRGRPRSARFHEALERAGHTVGSTSDYGLALLLLPPLLLVGWLGIGLVPDEVLTMPEVSAARITSVSTAVTAVLWAFGEEVFFRGLLGGVLMRRLGFAWGNLLQAVVLLLVHLPLLLIDTRLWPLLPAQFAASWVLGWLRHRTGTYLPGAVVHATVSIAMGLDLLRAVVHTTVGLSMGLIAV